MARIGIVVPLMGRPGKQKFVDLFFSSIDRLNYPKDNIEIVVSSHGDALTIPEGVKHIHSDTTLSFSQNVNKAIKGLEKPYDYILIGNDDTIYSHDSLKQMVDFSVSLSDRAIIGPVSNCGTFKSHAFPMPIEHENRLIFLNNNQYQYEELDTLFSSMMKAKGMGHGGFFTMWVAFFSVLIPKNVIESVGLLDEGYDCGQEDLDYCLMAQQKGIRSAVATNAVVWHFSGVTTSETMTDAMRSNNVAHFTSKWGFAPH